VLDVFEHVPDYYGFPWYRVNLSKYVSLNSHISESISSVNRYPARGSGFESSIPGLHFLGAPAAAWSFGILMHFVSGTHYASRAITRYIAAEPEAARGQNLRHGRSLQSI